MKKKKTQQTTKTHTVGKENGLMSGPDQNPNCLTLWCISDFFFEKIDVEKKQQQMTKVMLNCPVGKENGWGKARESIGPHLFNSLPTC